VNPKIKANRKLLWEVNLISKDICKLTPREVEVVKDIANGCSNKEIGKNLYIAEKTVKNHITRILSKLFLENRSQVVAYAFRNKLMDI